MPAVPLVTSTHLRDAQGSAESAMSTDSNPTAIDRRLRKLLKMDEQIRLLLEHSNARALTADEQAKVDGHALVQLEIQMLSASMQTPPAAGTSAEALGSICSAAPTMPAAASVAAAVAASQSALDELTPLPTRVGTRNSAIEVRPLRDVLVRAQYARRPHMHVCSQVMRKMARDRAAFELTRQALQECAKAAESSLLSLLRNPLASWGETAVWQLAMCEFAVEHIDDVELSAKQLQVQFRAACEGARHPAEVPRLRGSLQIDQLAATFKRSSVLRGELRRQLEVFKRHYSSLFSGFGRFRHVSHVNVSLLALMTSTHHDALKWRPPGATPAEQLAVQSKDNGRYVATWREETGEMMHEATGRTLSLRGTAGANRLGARRYLKKVPEGQRPSQEHWGTIRLHAMQAHHIQRSKSLVNSFSRNRCVLQWDEVTLNHLAWSVIVLNAPHASTNLREREVISCAKLGKDVDGAAKTGKNVGGAVTTSLKEYDMPVANVDFCCSDTTSYNSSLNLPKDLGGRGTGKGGAYAHMWAWMRDLGHVLFFMIWCLSHLGSNEVQKVMEAAGPCRRTVLVKKKGTRDTSKSDERVLLVEHLTDLHHVACTTEGCGACTPPYNMHALGHAHACTCACLARADLCLLLICGLLCAVDYLREAEGLRVLKEPPGGSNTRWPYWIDCADWFCPAENEVRYENLFTYLLHVWLLAQGNEGIGLATPSAIAVDDANAGSSSTLQPPQPQTRLSGAELVAKVKLIKDDARRQLLEEMCDPAIRVWLIFLAIYGRMSDLDCSMKRFLNFTQNDKAGTAFKAARVVRSRCDYLDHLADDDRDPLQHPDFAELRKYVESRPITYTNLDEVRKIVRTGAAEAVFYFRGESGAASTPREQRALRWLELVPLLVLGLMDGKGAVLTARKLQSIGKQGIKGYAQAILPYMPDACRLSELEEAILDAKAGPCVACQPQFAKLIDTLAGQHDESVTLESLFDHSEVGDASRELHSVLFALRFTPVGNFISETVVKTLEHGLHGTQRRTQSYATMLVSARHRPQRWPMSDSDFYWASREIGTSKSSSKTVKRDLGLQLQSINMYSEMPGLDQEVMWLKDDELQEAEPTADEADAAAADDDRGGIAGCAQDPKVKVGDIRRALSNDTVVEVLWEYTPEGKPVVYLALIEEVKSRIIRARWLHEIESCDDVFIIDPNYKTASIEMKQIWDTCADVTEPAEDRPDEVSTAVRWWRRAPSAGEAASDANDEADG